MNGAVSRAVWAGALFVLASLPCWAEGNDDLAQAQTWAVESTAFAEAAVASCRLILQADALDSHLALVGLDRHTAEERFAPVFAKAEVEFRLAAARTGGLQECLAAYDLLGPDNLNLVALPMPAADQLIEEHLLSRVPPEAAGR